MANNIFEQLDEVYSRWTMLDKIGKEVQLESMWQRTVAAYKYLYQVYKKRGYLTLGEAKYANHVSQILKSLQNQKMKVDQDMSNEMMKHLVKMKIKQI